MYYTFVNPARLLNFSDEKGPGDEFHQPGQGEQS
jgi:hypothetical protein